MADPFSDRLAVWTDFGGVLTPPIAHTFTTFCRSMDISPDTLLMAVGTVTAHFGTDDMMEPIDTPLISEPEWLARISRVLLAEHGIDRRLTTLADTWFDNRETNEAWVRRLARLRERGAFVGMMSNMVPAWDAHWRRMVPADRLFDDVILSFQTGLRKPSPGIFRLAEARAGLPASHCVLVDDSERNCAGARESGWRAVLFTDADTAWAELEPMLAPAGDGAPA